MSRVGRLRELAVGDSVQIDTDWADDEFPNVRGTVVGLRHGGEVAIIDTPGSGPLRTLHVNYLR